MGYLEGTEGTPPPLPLFPEEAAVSQRVAAAEGKRVGSRPTGQHARRTITPSR
ncbi:hypothetical protein LAUMK41_02259 [Mycobacterium attenuatum]|nr:hypothetical protein LAUMK41_02259 [Mycobacterium attenuatum]